MKLVGYVRVSRVGGREGDGYISPAIQRSAIAAYASEIGGEVVEWFTDEDYSGGSAERPGFQAALEADADGIVVMRIDRFARSVADGARIVRELTDAGRIFASCHERIDPRTPEGRFMLTSFLANAELFLDQSKAGWQTAKARAVARGVHIGPTPIGYRRKRSHPLEIDPLAGPAITELFRRAPVHSPTELARWFSERVPRPARPFQSSEIHRWLRSRVYLGEVHYGALSNPQAHPPLTDAATFEAAQRPAGIQQTAHSFFMLRGLLRCAHCRYGMSGHSYGGSDGRTPVYRCGGRCARPSLITAAKVEGHLIGLVREHLAGRAVEARESAADLDQAEQALEAAVAELAAFASDLDARRMLGEDGWRLALTIRAAERDRWAERVRDLRAVRAAAAIERVEDLDRHALRGLLLGWVRFAFVRKGRGDDRVLVIFSDDPRTIEVAGPHRGGPFSPIEW